MDRQKQQSSSYQSYENIDYSKLSQAQMEAEFRRQHQQYIAQKMARKKQMLRLRRAEFGSSSSDESEGDEENHSDSSKSSIQKKPQKKSKSRQPIQNSSGNKEENKNEQSIEKFPINSFKKGGQWAKDVLLFSPGSIELQNSSYKIKEFTKIKIIAEQTMGYPYRIKINYEDSILLFSPSVGQNQQKNNLLLNYYPFARIIQQKLLHDEVKLMQNKQEKIPGVPQTLIKNTYIYGRIYKKSQVLGKWEQRFVVINREGLFSYKKFNQKHTMQILSGSIKQLWTRFEIHEQFLVIKVMHNLSKIQFGIPLNEMLSKNCWLYNFFGVMNRR